MLDFSMIILSTKTFIWKVASSRQIIELEPHID